MVAAVISYSISLLKLYGYHEGQPIHRQSVKACADIDILETLDILDALGALTAAIISKFANRLKR
ncbi:hypothetical protein CAP50_04880 [Psychrobacter sp. L7]|nr:hypothetical protein BTV99_03970 [Psychrobacter sp. Rd 27.2]PJX24899.1 hypothetical protein CAP50_04880 [Psychrobacter sp. L7]